MKNIWKEKFDKIYCIRWTGKGLLDLNDTSYPLISELKRVGILDSGIFEMVYSTNMPSNIAYYERMNGFEFPEEQLEERFIHVTMTHYQTIKTSYELGYKRILILEDDILFLNDINKLYEYIKNIPDNGEIILFDYIELPGIGDPDDVYHKDILKSKYYHNFYSGLLSSCYSLNTEGMKYLIWCIENGPMYEIDKYFSYYDVYYSNCHNGKYTAKNQVPKMIASNINLAIQTYDYKSIYTGAYADANNDFKCNIDIENYNTNILNN